jgi:hypothetical protein
MAMIKRRSGGYTLLILHYIFFVIHFLVHVNLFNFLMLSGDKSCFMVVGRNDLRTGQTDFSVLLHDIGSL